MTSGKAGILASLTFSLVMAPASQASLRQDISSYNQGVVVQRVVQHSEAEKAGIQEGDVFVRWARGDVHGEIQSPFDLNAAEIEQAARGNVLLEGLRGKEKRTWQLGQDQWGIQVRPNFPDAILTLYQTGQDFATAGKLSEAAEKWRLIFDQGDGSNQQWLLFHLAGLQADAGHWQEADRSYQEALQISAASRDAVVQIHMAWGRTFVQHNDWEHAGEHFGQAMAAARAMGDNSLALATVLDELGGLAQKQGNLKKADGYYQQALRVRENWNPASLPTSTTLNNLGALAAQRGDLDKAEELDQRALAMAEKIAPDSLTVAQALGNLGDVASARGKLDKAGEYYRRSFDIYKALEQDGLGVAKALHGLGWVAWKSGDLAKAEEYHRRALIIREIAAPDGLDVAQSLSDIGNVIWQRGDLAGAAEYYRRALAIRERLAPGSMDLAMSLINLGNVAFQRSDLARCEEYYRQALAIEETLAPGSLDTAKCLNNLGVVAWQRGDLSGAEDYYRRALATREKLAPGSVDVATSLTNLGIVAYQRGDLARAEDYFTKSLAIKSRLAPDSLDVAKILTNLGNVISDKGDLVRAEDHYTKSLAIQERLAPGSLDVANTLTNLVFVAESRGDLAKAEDYQRQALAIQERLAPGSLDAAMGFYNLGGIAREREDLAKAEDYQRRGLAIRERLAPGSLNVALSLNELGLIALERGDPARAEDYQRRGLAIREKLAPGSLDVAMSLNDLGMIARERGNGVEAEKYCRQALSIRERLAPFSVNTAWNLNLLAQLLEGRGAIDEAEQYYQKASAILDKLAPGSVNLADSLAGLASIRRRQGRLEEAAQFYAQALDAVDAQTAHLGGGTDVRADFRAKRGNYREYMGVLLAQGKPEGAFEVLERSRARILLEILATAHIDIRRGVSPELLKKERSLQSDIKAKSARRVHLLSEKQSEEQVKAVEKEISALTQEYQDVEAQIRLNSPAYAALMQPQPLSAEAIRHLLPEDTLLLEYSLDEPRSYVFALTTDSIHSYELPGSGVIEPVARGWRQALTERSRIVAGETVEDRRARLAKAETRLQKAGAELSRRVLGPVAAELKARRLLIVGDEPLQYVPFAGLPSPESLSRRRPVPLIVEHEIAYLPSASVLALLRREEKQRDLGSTRREVVVLADPVFDKGDSRVRSIAPRMPSGGDAGQQRSFSGPHTRFDDTLTRSVEDANPNLRQGVGFRLPRLAFTRMEAKAILSVVPRGSSKAALGFEANRTLAVGGELKQYRVVHFATHALVDNIHPELSGLVLSLVDRKGEPIEGFLDLEDIYNLDLSADLVVLSACDTALGKELKGEGMISLTRGFMYAGAPRVIASLWNVDDFATTKLMTYFYQAMERDGMKPGQALRQAQLAMWRQHSSSAPYYWAGFVLQGDWE